MNSYLHLHTMNHLKLLLLKSFNTNLSNAVTQLITNILTLFFTKKDKELLFRVVLHLSVHEGPYVLKVLRSECRCTVPQMYTTELTNAEFWVLTE